MTQEKDQEKAETQTPIEEIADIKNESVVLKQGADVDVETIDGETQVVRVGLVKLKAMPAYYTVIEDEIGMIKLVTELTDDEIENISFKSQLQLVKVARDINFTNAQEWAEYRAGINEALAPMAQRGVKIREAMTQS